MAHRNGIGRDFKFCEMTTHMEQQRIPSIAEFKQAAQKCQRRINRSIIVALGMVFGFILLGGAFRSVGIAKLGQTWGEFVPAGIFLLGVPCFVYGLWRADQHSKDFPELWCPHCDKSLANLPHHVIASHNCPHCGLQVVQTPSKDV